MAIDQAAMPAAMSPALAGGGMGGGADRGAGVRAVARRVLAMYKGTALLFFNTLVVYVLINLVIAGGFRARAAWRAKTLRSVDPITAKYGPELLDRVYPGVNRADRVAMLNENWTRSYLYDDYTHFRERPIEGRYVNVTPAGFRKSADQGPWPPSPDNLNVFFFGGSTTFGYGLPDGQTIPSHFQRALAAHSKRRVCVYNFAVGWFYSTQERILFEKLVCQGIVPHVVIFVDGVNDAGRYDNKPAFSGAMGTAFEESRLQGWIRLCFRRAPVGWASESFLRKYLPAAIETAPGADKQREGVSRARDTYLTNKFSIEKWCERFGSTPIFVWQPAPGYDYDMKYHLFAPPGAFPEQSPMYSALRDRLKDLPAESNFLWCADLQQGHTEPIYCDYNHYTGGFCKVIADAICQLCIERNLLDKHLNR
jgi:hypothetical protein